MLEMNTFGKRNHYIIKYTQNQKSSLNFIKKKKNDFISFNNNKSLNLDCKHKITIKL